MNLIGRILIASAVASAGLSAQGLAAPTAQQKAVEQVDALNKAFGAHPGARALYAKGFLMQGIFSPSPNAASVTKAKNFSAPLQIVVRFSDFSGDPKIADTDPMASPHGMAIKFYLPNDTEADIVASSYNGFPVATSDEFLAFINALAASGAGAGKPTALDKFEADHSAAAAFLQKQNPPPQSFATESYYGVNTFKFTNAQGQVTYGRYQIRPVAGEHFLGKDEAAKADPDYLTKEIKARLGKGPIFFKLFLQVADKSDDIANPSIAWPDTRKTIELGTIEIGKAMDDNAIAQREIVFLPTVTPDGIDPADPMIEDRAHAYVESYSRRSQGQ